MAKYYGSVGFATTIEDENNPGIWIPFIVEKKYYGDILRTSSNWRASSNGTNDDIEVSNQISILADPYAYQNFSSIRYAEIMGVKWKVNSIDIEQRPRIKLNLGGVYNE